MYFAFNDPKQYPKKPFSYEEDVKEEKIMTDDEMRNVFDLFRIRMKQSKEK